MKRGIMPKLTRREWFETATAVAGSLLVSSVHGAGLVRGQGTPSMPDVDHLIWGVADLEAGIDHLERLTGVRAAVGGSHPNRGTRNGILALGTRQYIEILAPDPQQPHIATPRVTLLKQLQTPRLMTWCALGQDVDALARQVQEAGETVDEIRDGARERPDGVVLRWRNLYIAGHQGDVIPYVIEWGEGVPHPSGDAPQGGTLQLLSLHHPEASRMNVLLEALGLSLRVESGTTAKLTAELDTPLGRVVLE